MRAESLSPETLVPDVPEPPTFDEAVRTGVRRLQDALAQFEAMAARIPEDAYREGEGKVLESTAAEVERLIEAAQIHYESAAYHTQAGDHIIEDLPPAPRNLAAPGFPDPAPALLVAPRPLHT